MDTSDFEKYIREMREMKAKAVLSSNYKETEKEPESIQNSDSMTGKGYLIVNVTSARGLYPVQNAQVTVFTGENGNRLIVAEELTDISGKTPKIELPAPASRYSETPSPAERPYAYYNIHTLADGFRENLNYNAAVFDGTTSVQSVNLEPLTSGVSGNRPIVINGADSYTL